MKLSRLSILIVLILVPVAAFGQVAGNQEKPLTDQQKQNADAEALAAERRTFVVSQLISLADEARTYKEVGLRAQVLVRVADALWNTDDDAARRIFRRAWEAAEVADTEEANAKVEDRQMQMVAALRRMGGVNKRNEVLRVVARRDEALAEEFLSKLREQTSDGADSKSKTSSEDLTRRLQLARRLLEDGAVDQAVAFAGPALVQVNQDSIGFLSSLRGKRPEIADQTYTRLMTRAEFDPASDANTVSLLFSYAFTPGYYMIYKADGTSSWGFEDATPKPPPNLPAEVRSTFFKVAAGILLRPLPPIDQDTTTSGRKGKYAVIKKLLALFDQNAPDSATALRAQLTALASELPKGRMNDPGQSGDTENFGPPSLPSPSDVLERLQEQLDHTKSSKERDLLCRRAAAELADQGDARAIDVSNKIEDAKMRNEVRAYVDFQLARFALKKKDLTEAVRLAKKGQLTHLQRGWCYLQVVRLLTKAEQPDKSQITGLLEETGEEARRMDDSDPDKARVFFGAATQFFPFDEVRTWELVSESIRAANATENFTGDKTSMFSMPLSMKAGTAFDTISEEGFGIAPVMRLLAKNDLNRSLEVARSLKRDGPRAIGILAIANAILEEPLAQNREPK
ncbi:MAG: hypothetical protein ACXW18_12315 [Pyrinomonadaceae bacterium]